MRKKGTLGIALITFMATLAVLGSGYFMSSSYSNWKNNEKICQTDTDCGFLSRLSCKNKFEYSSPDGKTVISLSSGGICTGNAEDISKEKVRAAGKTLGYKIEFSSNKVFGSQTSKECNNNVGCGSNFYCEKGVCKAMEIIRVRDPPKVCGEYNRRAEETSAAVEVRNKIFLEKNAIIDSYYAGLMEDMYLVRNAEGKEVAHIKETDLKQRNIATLKRLQIKYNES